MDSPLVLFNVTVSHENGSLYDARNLTITDSTQGMDFCDTDVSTKGVFVTSTKKNMFGVRFTLASLLGKLDLSVCGPLLQWRVVDGLGFLRFAAIRWFSLLEIQGRNEPYAKEKVRAWFWYTQISSFSVPFFHVFLGEERRYARVWIGVWESLQVPNHISSIKNISYFCRSVTDNTSDQFSAINSLTPSKPSFSPRTEHSYGGLFSNQYPTIQSSTHIFISLFSHVNIPLCRTATAQRFFFLPGS